MKDPIPTGQAGPNHGPPGRARKFLVRLTAAAATIAAMVPIALVGAPSAASAATAGQTLTYGATVTIPAPPSSNFSGASGGGDGWGVALSSTQIFNVFHHQQTLMVNCHNQADASACWSNYKTVTDASGNNFSTSGQPGMYLDQATGNLYVFATRTSDYTAGVVCIDTQSSAVNPFCGFTALSGVGDAPDSIGFSGVTDPVMVGHDWYAFNYVPGTPSGTEDQMLCFDTSADAPCASQPYTVDFGGGTVGSTSPAPGIVAIGSDVAVQVPASAGDVMACFDTATDSGCSGSWPASAANGFAGDPVPMLDGTGAITGVCTTASVPSCFDLTGAAVSLPAGFSAVVGNSSWNGSAVTIGSRIYLPDGNTNAVNCYDFSTSSVCADFPKAFSNLGLLYTVNPDPQRPTCLWVNSDYGTSQIQNFDAYTGGTCANAPLRIQASSVVATNNSVCVPASWTSLQVQAPSPSSYTSGAVDFDDSDGNPIAGVATHNLDATGTTSLTDLNLPSTDALPQFVITLTGLTGSPSTAQVYLTWAGTYSPDCVQGTTVVTAATAPGQPAAPTVAAGDGAATVSWTAPASDGYSPITGYTATAYDASGTPAGTCSAAATATSCQVNGLTDGDGYTFTVTATNAVGSTTSPASAQVVPTGPSVAGATLPAGTVGRSYSTTLVVNGGVGPYAWAVTSGSLPAGLNLAGDGTLSGTPSAAETSTFTGQVTDVNGVTSSGQFSVTVDSVPSVAASTTLPDGTVGGAYRASMTVAGGVGPCTWSVTSGSLPAGLRLNSDGSVTGTPTAAGTSTVIVTVTDANGATARGQTSVTINAAPALPEGGTTTVASSGTSVSTNVTPSGGTGPYSWAVISGTLPPGVVLDAATGTIQGTATLPGTYTFTVQVTDANGVTATEKVTLSVQPSNVNTRPIASTPDGHGYWVTSPQGGVDSFGDAHNYGSLTGRPLNAPVVGIESTPSGHGYWLVGSDGGVFTFGDAGYYGSTTGTHLAGQVLGLIPTVDGRGYWLVAADGGVFTFGDARYYGSRGGQSLAAPVVGMVATVDDKGYWLVAADGGVFAYGDARFYGSAAGVHLAAPIVGMAGTPDGHGYRLVGSDGGVLTFGDAPFYGSAAGVHLAAPVDGIQSTPDGKGYWLVGSDGGVFSYGDAPFTGSVPGRGGAYS